MAVGATDRHCRVTVANTGESFACAPDQLILDAALAAGIGLAHNCRGGACGTCKSEVLEGEVDHGWVMSFAITEAEKAAGKCLICQSRPRSDRLVIRTDGEVTTPGGLVPVAIEVTAMVVAAEALTPSVRRLVVALPRAVDFRYRAGMHVAITTPGVARARTYSIATVPDAEGRPPDGLLELFVTRHAGGRASGWLHHDDLVGAPLTLRGPHGGFTWPATSDPVLCLAGGSGLAPLLSMVGWALADGSPGTGVAPVAGDGQAAPIVLVLSVRSRAEVLGLDLLHALARHHGRFRHLVTLTRGGMDEAPVGWRRGRVSDWLGQELPDLGGWRVLVAGPPGFVDACTAAARQLGARDASILTDSFTATADG